MTQAQQSDALNFLQILHANLDRRLPTAHLMKERIEELIARGKADATYRYLCSPEHAFTRGLALPHVHEVLTGTFGLSPANATQALLAEGWANFKSISSNTPARSVRHPFDKAMVSDAWSTYQKWRKKTSRLPLTQSCPDFALRRPAPHKIVFEAKYFQGTSLRQAATELVAALYQAFFYRSLPPTGNRQGRSWDYDYACLCAFDSSQDGLLKEAWEVIDQDVKDGFWEGANVYVMVLTGSQN